jgi:hypothetical protein
VAVSRPRFDSLLEKLALFQNLICCLVHHPLLYLGLDPLHISRVENIPSHLLREGPLLLIIIGLYLLDIKLILLIFRFKHIRWVVMGWDDIYKVILFKDTPERLVV